MKKILSTFKVYNKHTRLAFNLSKSLLKFQKFSFCSKLDNEESHFNFFHDENSYIKSVIVEMNCKGCGVNLQYEHPDKIGYIPESKVKDFIENDKIEEKENKEATVSELKEFEKIKDYK
jgi:hypothetical protein